MAEEKTNAPKEGNERGSRAAREKEKKKAKKVVLADKARPPARLWARYNDEVRATLKESLGLGNVNEVPRLEKIVLNMGLGEAISNNKVLELAVDELSAITGQKAVVTRAKKSISNFKLREGMPIGAMVTLRRARMWEFLDRLISVALPRVRDFQGISDKAFDGRGNYTLGLKEQIIFPEIDYDAVDKIRGLNICIVTSARTDEHGKALLQALGLPLKKRVQQQKQEAATHG